ncbi:nudix (nucleoside diphosphate linked moiety X)-type motif 2 [Mortierella sp. GBA35]|nr:nudix (nucleoside diphosphate linked moiety X)-type motif 2 [Mortierella sp. AD031]KAF9103965.1 nudix (nucleoside diphosphate linked moiety X)-type motif 2 [Mortierella sp. GBA35]KAG0211161.1 nudix (nucleoside diphosphate linked moiety X)-type motif 2 [Mortierella sp. NVP41]
MDKSLHVTGILIYRHQRNSTEILLVNDSFNHKRHWTAPKGRVIGDEDELKCALRETTEITGLAVKDLKVEESFRAEIKYLSGTRPKRVVYYLAELTDSAKILPTGEGVQFSWCNVQQATDKALYRTMQDVLRMAFTAAENNRAKALAAAPPKIRRDHSNNSGGDSLESNMKNLNIALPLDSQRQAITRDYNNNRHGGSGQNRDRGDRDGNGRYNNNSGNNNNGGSGNLSHADNPNYKTRLCERFETEQFCPYYGKCTFAHGAAELRQRPVSAEQQDKPMSAVQASYQNRAKRTEPTENEFHKTRLCERFMNDGECPFGTKCTYAHGREELRQRAGYQNNQNNQNGGYNNNGQNRGYNRDVQNGERSYRSNGEGYQDRGGYRSQQPPQQQSSNEGPEERPHRPVRTEGPYRSTFAENARENRDGPYRPPQALDQERSTNFRSQAEANPTGAYRPPGARSLSSQNNDDTSLTRPAVLAPRATIATPAAATPAAAAAQLAPAATTPAATSPATTPILGSEKSGNGRRRVQELNDKPRAKVVEMSSEDMEKFQLRRPETPVQTKPDSKQAQRDQLIQDLQKFFQNGQQQQEGGALDKKQQQQQLQDEIKEVTRVEMRNGLTKPQLYYILVASLFTETSVETWKKVLVEKEKLLANFVRSTDDQLALMRAWEQLFVKHRPNMMTRAPIVMKGLYDIELVEEDVMLNWYDLPTTDSDLKKKCVVFVDWLRSAEEE